MSQTTTTHAPRQDVQLEQAVLGALLLEKEAYYQVSDLLTPETFFCPSHQRIYQAISDLGAQQAPIDMLTVMQQLLRNGALAEVQSPDALESGAVYITSLASRMSSAAHVAYHAQILAQLSLGRRLLALSREMQEKATDERNDVDDLLQEAEARLFALGQGNARREAVQLNPLLSGAMARLTDAVERGSELAGLASGFADLDKITSGWQASDLVIIAARPAMGKTAFVLSMAKQMAVDEGVPVALFSLEMSAEQVTNRLIINACEIDGEKLRNARMGDEEWERLLSRSEVLYDAPLYIDDTPALSVFELRSKARRLVREHGIKMIIIDYLQLMTASGAKFGSREQEVSSISRSLKGLAKELNIPVIALSQLNRAVEARQGDGKRPQLSDLRESGAIEQDADMVCFIHRPEYYKIFEDESGNDLRGVAELIIAKHRNGAVGDVRMRFRSELARFEA
jgi:replicative DNA helicase